jgi:hypothetical protein
MTTEALPADYAPARHAREERLDRIRAEAATMRPGRSAMTFVASVLFGAAWVLGKAMKVVWTSLAFTVAAWRVGWNDALGRGPSKSQLLEENRLLRVELERWSGDAAATARIQRGMPARRP